MRDLSRQITTTEDLSDGIDVLFAVEPKRGALGHETMLDAPRSKPGPPNPQPNSLSPCRVAELWPKICTGVVDHGFTIVLKRLEKPKTGTFDGLQIHIDPGNDFELQCFILLHLFGHCVQWVAPSIEHKLAGILATGDFERFMKALRAYEYDAARYGLQLLHEMGVEDLDQWLSDLAETDWRYVEHFYRTGKVGDLAQFTAGGAALIQPAAIPQLRHRQVEPRFSF